MSELLLGIAVVTYRSDDTLPECLESIRRFSPGAFVVVVENSGDPAGVRIVSDAVAPLEVEVVDPRGNVGYAKGVNLGADRIMARGCTHLLILNPDVQLMANPLALVPCLDRADVVAGVLLSGPRPDAQAGPNGLEVSNAKREITWTSSLVQALVGTRFNGIGTIPSGQLVSVPQVDGAFMFQSVEYYGRQKLDEAFELYFEDVEYCDRARERRGVMVLGRAVGVHSAGASASKSSGRAYIANRVSRARYLCRKYPRRPRAVLAAPFAIELGVRSITCQPESWETRLRACRLALRELRTPGSVWVLRSVHTPGAPSPDSPGGG